MTAEQRRRERLRRLGELAAEREERARGELHRADERLALADQQRADALQGAAALVAEGLPLAFQAHLTGVGARHLVHLAGERSELSERAGDCRTELAEAVGRVRSFERLVERLDRTLADRRRRRAAADLQDLVAVRAVVEGADR